MLDLTGEVLTHEINPKAVGRFGPSLRSLCLSSGWRRTNARRYKPATPSAAGNIAATYPAGSTVDGAPDLNL